MDKIKVYFTQTNMAGNKLKLDKFKDVLRSKLRNSGHKVETINELLRGTWQQIQISNSGKLSADKCKSIDLNQVSSATSTPINCKSMNCSKDGPSASKNEKPLKIPKSDTTKFEDDAMSKQSRL